MNYLKGLTFVCVSVYMASTFAQSRGSFVIDMAYDTADRIYNRAPRLSGAQLRDIRIKLGEINAIMSNRPAPAPRVTYEALCQVDNDTSFTYNQRNVGNISGTLSEIFKECDARAEAVYGKRSSAGIKDLVLLSSPRGMSEYQCWIDNDRDFTANQTFVGKIAASSTREATDICNQVAEFIYDGNGSAGLDF